MGDLSHQDQIYSIYEKIKIFDLKTILGFWNFQKKWKFRKKLSFLGNGNLKTFEYNVLVFQTRPDIHARKEWIYNANEALVWRRAEEAKCTFSIQIKVRRLACLLIADTIKSTHQISLENMLHIPFPGSITLKKSVDVNDFVHDIILK